MENETNEMKDTLILENLCPLRYALDTVGGKWKLPIICLLSNNLPTRYSMIKRKVTGITNMMLSQSLKELEAHDIVHRKQYNEIPPRVEYSLTEEGQSLLPTLQLLARWGVTHINEKNAGIVHCEGCQSDLCKGR